MHLAGILLRVVLASAAGLAAAMTAGIMSLGVLWLFVLGDDPWPSWSEPAISGIAVLAGAVTFAAVMYAGLRPRQG